MIVTETKVRNIGQKHSGPSVPANGNAIQEKAGKTMFGSNSRFDLDRNFERPARHRRLPQLALRQRRSDHPMVMFVMLVSAAFVSMALMMPASGASLTVMGAPAKAASGSVAAAPKSEVQRACEGQAWGAQSEGCLMAIAKASGKTERLVRMVDAGAPTRTTPNVF